MAARNMTPMMMGMVQSKLLDPNPSPLNPLAGVNRSILNIGSAVSAYQSGERRAGILYAKTVGANGLVNAINSYQSGERRAGMLALQALDAKNALSAVNAYQAGERRPLALAAHWTGVTNALIGAHNFTTQWHADARTVFLGGSPWYDRLPAAARMGSTAMAVSGVAAGGWMMVRQPVINWFGGNPQGFFGSSIPDIATIRNGSIYLTNGRPLTGPTITEPYSRPSGATTRAQRQSVQGQPCVDCGAITPNQVADHKTPLVQEYYETGTIDTEYMRSLDAVQSQCPTCSARQGSILSRFSREMKKLFGLE